MSHQIIFYVEGYAELEFVNEIIGPHLNAIGLVWHKPILVANSVREDRTARGGVRKYGPIKKDLQRLLAQYGGTDFIFTTLLDYYGLPADFPARNDSFPGVVTPLAKVKAIEDAWRNDINDYRFLPNLLLHEYETLILSNPASLLAGYPGIQQAIEDLRNDIAGFQNPEDINDNPLTAPSKRIIRALDAYNIRYDKVTGGALAVLELGLNTIRKECPKFDSWVKKLESLADN
ncbi:conserved hypothetical protein [delta proteobacterium NaphS2]|nr:conserved hypothetical protein [delta proteobacterium NaphS2]